MAITCHTPFPERSPQYAAVISVANTCRAIPERCRVIAGGVTKSGSPPSKPEYKPHWTWRVKGQVAAAVARATSPYLVAKVRQAQLAIRLQERMRMGAEEGDYGQERLTPQELGLRQDLFDAMHALNWRGTTRIPDRLLSARRRVLPESPSTAADTPAVV